MSNTKLEPLLGEASHIDAPCQYNSNEAWAWACGYDHAREAYEAARAKDAELIQRLVDAIQGEAVRCGDGFCKLSTEALAAAEAAGFKPTDQ